MAGLNGVITVTTSEYRPCLVKGRKAIFHRWGEGKKIFHDFLMVDGIEKATWTSIKETISTAIIEFEDGTVAEVDPTDIKFYDPPHKEYYFGTEEQTQ